jgi:hypothetical protein
MNSPTPPDNNGFHINTSEIYYRHPSLVWKNAQLVESNEKEVKIKDKESFVLIPCEETLPKVLLIHCLVLTSFFTFFVGNFNRIHS